MYKTIVVGTDASSSARRALEHALELAALTGASLHVAVGYKPPSQAIIAGAPEAPLGALPTDEEVRGALERDIAAQLSETRHSDVDHEVHLVAGGGAHAVLEVAETVEADCVVVGSQGMTGVGRVLGSVPNNVAHHAHCTVIIVDTR